MVNLYEQISRIDDIPDFVEYDKKKAIRKALDSWKGHNGIVASVLNGETTFKEAQQRYLATGQGSKAFLPDFNPPQERYSRDLEDALGVVVIGRDAYTRIAVNPVSLGVEYAVMRSGASVYFDKHISRRDLLRSFFKGAWLGAFLGTIFSGIKALGNVTISGHAEYLDEAVRKWYRQ